MTDSVRLQQFTKYMEGKQVSLQEKDHVEGGQLLSGRLWRILSWIPLISIFAKWHFMTISKQEVRSLNEKRLAVHLQHVDVNISTFQINGHIFSVKVEGKRQYPDNILITEWKALESAASDDAVASIDAETDEGVAEEEEESVASDDIAASIDAETDEDAIQEEQSAVSELTSASKSSVTDSRAPVLIPVNPSSDPLQQPLSSSSSDLASSAAAAAAASEIPYTLTLEERLQVAAPYIANCCRHAIGLSYSDTQVSTIFSTLYPLLKNHLLMELLVEPILAATVESESYVHLKPFLAFRSVIELYRTEIALARTRNNQMKERVAVLRQRVENAKELVRNWKQGPLPQKHVGKNLTLKQQKENAERATKETEMYMFADENNADLLTKHLFIYLNETAIRSKQITGGLTGLGVWLASAAHATGVASGLIESFVQNALVNILKLAAHSQNLDKWSDDVDTSRREFAHAATGFLPGLLNNCYDEVIIEVKFFQYLDAYIQGQTKSLENFGERVAEVLEAAAKQVELFQDAFVKMITEQRTRLAQK